MKTIRMTDRWVRTVAVDQGRAEYSDALVRGLRLRVSRRSKKWSVLTRKNGKQHRVPIGEVDAITLKEAREEADRILRGEPALSKTQENGADGPSDQTPLLEEICAAYVARMEKKGQPSHSEYKRALIDSDHSFCNFMEEELERLPRVGDVTPGHVSSWLRGIYERAPSHARHCRAYLHAVFEWALKAEFDYTTSASGKNYGISANPVAATPGGAKSNARNRVLTKEELATVWRSLPQAAEPRTAICVRLIIAMGGIRITEVCRSEWDWYDDDWLTLPKTKNTREHALPLTDHAKDQFILAKALAVSGSRFLFPHQLDDDQSLLVTSVGKVARRLIEDFNVAPFQMRDLRRTMKTHLLDGEYVEEREIDIWHNHGQNSDVARKHYTWAEYKKLKQRVAGQIDSFLDTLDL